MTVVKKLTFYYEGLAEDPKPTGVLPGTVFRETDTQAKYISYDGDTWEVADSRVRLVGEDGTFLDIPTALAALGLQLGAVTASPAAYSVLGRAKAIVTAVEALKTYEFSINGVNFNGYAGIKTLILDALADSTHFTTLHHYNVAGAKVDYQVPGGSVFIAYQAMIIMATTAAIGRIGESEEADGAGSPGGMEKDVLFFGNGTLLPFMTACYGVFTAGKFVTASAVSSSDMEQYSVLFGVERDA